jgi:hypothetical protein
MWGWIFISNPWSLAGTLEQPRFANGAPRSLTNTNGVFVSCSRCSRRRARPKGN